MVDDIEMARPKGLLIPFDKFVILDILPPEQYKNVLTKMRQYVEHGKEPEGLEDLEKMAFESLRSSMDTNIETYRRSILANRKNGRKGGSLCHRPVEQPFQQTWLPIYHKWYGSLRERQYP